MGTSGERGTVRLFTALWPPEEVCAATAAAVAGADLAGWRPTSRERWHVTLAFHGDDDPLVRARDLDERLTGAPAPRLRIAGAGTFPGVLWASVRTAGPGDTAALDHLVAGAGGDPARFVGHLTLARTRDRRRPAPPLDLPPGPWWTPAEVVLVSSTPTGYHPLHRTPLTTG